MHLGNQTLLRRLQANPERGAASSIPEFGGPEFGGPELEGAEHATPGQPSGAKGRGSLAIHQAAAAGIRDGGASLPHLDRIQDSFGPHDISEVRAHTSAAAVKAAQSIGASAFAVGEHVAFDGQPDLFTAAHEAAHVVQQRAGVDIPDGVGRSGDSFELDADQVAARVVQGRSAGDLLGSPVTSKAAGSLTGHNPAVQRQERQKKAEAAAAARDEKLSKNVTDIINAGLAKVDENLIKGVKDVRLAIKDDAGFLRAWQDYCDRSNRSGAAMEEGLNGFVDPTFPGGQKGFVRAGQGIGTGIHEGMHQRAAPGFYPGSAGTNVNEGTTEVFTRVVIAYAGGNIERNVYENEKTAMLRLQGISGLSALAQWYFKNDRAAVEKEVGAQRLGQFMDEMDGPGRDPNVAVRAENAIKVL
jgi:hypothetical protein